MKRKAHGLFVIALLVCAGSVPARAETYSWRYTVAPFHDPTEIATPMGGPTFAPLGMVAMVPDTSSVTVTIADDVNPDGRFLFSICQPNEPHVDDYHCGAGHDDVSTGDICYAGPHTLHGVVPGNPVEIILRWAPTPCPDAPTTGTLTVVG